MRVIVAIVSTGLLGLIAWQDIRKRMVANWLTVPLLLAAVVWQLGEDDWQAGLLLVWLLLADEILDRLKLPAVFGIGPAALLAGWLVNVSGAADTQLVLITWLCAWSAWTMHLVGGADAKVAMAMIGFFPDLCLVAALLGAQVGWSVYHLIRRYGRGALKAVLLGMIGRPIEDDLDARGVPMLPAYAAAGIVFVWWRAIVG